MSKITLICAAIAFILIQHIPQSHGSATDLITDTIIKNLLVKAGYSEVQADCMTKVLKFEGVTNDVTDIRNIIFFEELLEKVKHKVDFAYFICENGPLMLVVVMIAIGMMCCCCICCCCRSKQTPLRMPATINLSIPYHAQAFEIPYERVDKV